MATTRAHTATVHTPIFKHAPSHRTDIYLSVQWRQFIHAYPQDKLASLKVMLFLTTTNRQIVEDTSIAQKDFKVPCQVIFLNISLPVRQKLWAHRTISGNKISSFCCAARISLDSRFSFPLTNIFISAFYGTWFFLKMPSLPFSHLFLLLLLSHISISSGGKRDIVDVKSVFKTFSLPIPLPLPLHFSADRTKVHRVKVRSCSGWQAKVFHNLKSEDYDCIDYIYTMPRMVLTWRTLWKKTCQSREIFPHFNKSTI